jgi:hypothetical protein
MVGSSSFLDTTGTNEDEGKIMKALIEEYVQATGPTSTPSSYRFRQGFECMGGESIILEGLKSFPQVLSYPEEVQCF